MLVPSHKPLDPMIDLYDGYIFALENKGGYMDEDVCGSRRIRFSCYITEINLRWNGVQWWIGNILVCIGLWT